MRRIGGSDISKLLGISKYGGPWDVYQRIINRVESEWTPPMLRGAVMEPVLRSYAQKTVQGLELEENESDLAIHTGVDFAHAQIDDFCTHFGLPSVIDYKSQSVWAKGWGPDNSDVVPASIEAQVRWEMACSDRDLAILFVGFGEDRPDPIVFDLSHFKAYYVERDAEKESMLLEVARRFWDDHIIPKVPPEEPKKKTKRTS